METPNALGRKLTLNLVDGSPYGVIVGELDNSLVMGVRAPRSLLKNMLNRQESDRSGIYILHGSDQPDDPRQRVYVGEAEIVRDRIRDHVRRKKKEYFTHAIYIVSNNNLKPISMGTRKALERIMIERLRGVSRAVIEVDNDNKPKEHDMHQADEHEVYRMMKHIESLLPALGFEFLKPIDGSTEISEEMHGSIMWTFTRQDDFAARMKVVNGEYLLLKDSSIRPIDVKGEEEKRDKSFIRDRLHNLETGRVISDSGRYIVTQNIPFRSPSGAACFVSGSSENGWEVWRNSKGGKKIGDVEKTRLAKWKVHKDDRSKNSRRLKTTGHTDQRFAGEGMSTQQRGAEDNDRMQQYRAGSIEARLEKRGDKEYVLLKGSIVKFVDRGRMQEKANESFIMERVEHHGKLDRMNHGDYMTTDEIPFRSLSGAASFVCGCRMNGNAFWEEK